MNNIKVLLDPGQRKKYLERMLKLDGLSMITEDENAAYCPISLTNTPGELKQILKKRQEILKQQVLLPAEIIGYDPSDAPFSPDRDLTTLPTDVYGIDCLKIALSKFFVGHDLAPSDGKGVEKQIARTLVKISVILLDKNIRVSRMQPTRAIYLQYENFEEQAPQFAEVFKMLKEYDVGAGLKNNLPVLIGFEKNSSRFVDLEWLVYETFPELQYKYNGNAPILTFRVENPQVLYELEQGVAT